MRRRVRKTIVYVCTLDGSIHGTAREARARAEELEAKERRRGGGAKRAGAKPRRKTRTDAVLRAIKDGARSAVDVREKTKIPPRLIHPMLSSLRKRGFVKGGSGTLALTAAGTKRVE